MFRRELGISRRDGKHMRREPASLTRLAELAALDMVVASRCVANMVKKGLIAKTRLPENKRVTVLALTEAGRIAYRLPTRGRCSRTSRRTPKRRQVVTWRIVWINGTRGTKLRN